MKLVGSNFRYIFWLAHFRNRLAPSNVAIIHTTHNTYYYPRIHVGNLHFCFNYYIS